MVRARARARAHQCCMSARLLGRAAPRRAAPRCAAGRAAGTRNARDVAGAAPRLALRRARLLRTATWGELGPDAQALRRVADELACGDARGVTLLDLRSAEEYSKDAGALPLALPVARETPSSEQFAAVPAADGASEASSLHRVNVSLLERERYERGLFGQLPLRDKGKVLYMKVFGGRNELRDWFIERINAGGLPQLYELLLATAGPEFGVALRTVTAHLEADRAVVFFCKAGKDRTGLIAALLLLCLGASEDEVVADYALSDSDETVAGLGGVEKEAPGLDMNIFSRAPASAMESTVVHLRERYGGHEVYLDSIGFGDEWRARLRAVLAA